MSAQILDGAKVAAAVRIEVAEQTRELKKRGVAPCLAVVLAGGEPASQIYVRNKEKACQEAGIKSSVHCLPADATEQQLIALIKNLNDDPAVHGILVQLPLPPGVDARTVFQAMDPAKDVDGFHPLNAGKLAAGLNSFVPCTPLGIMRLLAAYDISLEGKHAVVIGRSAIVGKPMAQLLLAANATVTVCHSKTVDLEGFTRSADLLVAAVGKPRFVTARMVKPGAAVVDVGINRIDGHLVGDVDFKNVKEVASSITPVPGGVGPLTIAMLLQNTLKAAM